MGRFWRRMPSRGRRSGGIVSAARLDRDSTKKERGDLGERIAADYLSKEKKFRVLVRNWRSGRDEIDLVCRDRDSLVFVEVKTRTGGGLVPGYFAVNRKKKEALLRVCRAYVRKLSVKPRTFRFDVVEVALWADRAPDIHHFETVRLFPKDLRFTR